MNFKNIALCLCLLHFLLLVFWARMMAKPLIYFHYKAIWVSFFFLFVYIFIIVLLQLLLEWGKNGEPSISKGIFNGRWMWNKHTERKLLCCCPIILVLPSSILVGAVLVNCIFKTTIVDQNKNILAFILCMREKRENFRNALLTSIHWWHALEASSNEIFFRKFVHTAIFGIDKAHKAKEKEKEKKTKWNKTREREKKERHLE